MFAKINKFMREVQQEMSKVSWPTREELRGSTIVVLIVSFIFATFTYFIDQGLSRLLNLLY